MSGRRAPAGPEVVPEVIDSAEGRRPRRSRVGARAVLVAVVVWCMLWGSFDLRTILGGALGGEETEEGFSLIQSRFP